jgi:hypothetical protein
MVEFKGHPLEITSKMADGSCLAKLTGENVPTCFVKIESWASTLTETDVSSASEQIVVETTSEPVPMESAITTNEPTEENAVPDASEEQTKESDVENNTYSSRKVRKSAPTPKTLTPKRVGRPKRNPPQSEQEIQSEVIETVEAPPLPSAEKKVSEKEPSEESSSNIEEVSVKTISTPKRCRRASTIKKRKAIRLSRGKRQKESDKFRHLCNECNGKFKYFSEFNRHKHYIHSCTEEKEFKCTLCRHSFVEKKTN